MTTTNKNKKYSYDQSIGSRENYNNLKKLYKGREKNTVECPVCKSMNFEKFHRQIIRYNTDYWIEDDSLLQCARCGTIQSETIYPPGFYFDFINEFYGVNPGSVGIGSRIKSVHRQNFLIAATFEKPFKINTLLEISSFDGATLDQLTKCFECDGYGVEPTATAVDLACTEYPHLADRMITAVFEDSAERLKGLKFELIIAAHAFRQIAHPVKALDIIESVISDDGYLMIDEGCFLEDMLTYPNSELAYSLFQQKNYYYSQTSLIYFLARRGFEFIANGCFHSAPGGQWLRRYSTLVFRRNPNAVADETYLAASKAASDTVIQRFRSVYKTPDETISAILETGAS